MSNGATNGATNGGAAEPMSQKLATPVSAIPLPATPRARASPCAPRGARRPRGAGLSAERNGAVSRATLAS